MRVWHGILAGLLAFSASPSWAQSAAIVRMDNYQFYERLVALQDRRCLDLAVADLSSHAFGLREMHFQMPSFWDSALQDIRIYSYGRVAIKSDYGTFDGSMICILSPKHNLVVETAFNFDGVGLAGFNDRTGAPRSQGFRLMHQTQLLAPIIE